MTRPGDLTARCQDITIVALREILADVELAEDEVPIVAAALIRTVTKGVRLGAAEVSAQALEAGFSFELNLEISSDDIAPGDLKR
jgi:hypothetical protein